MERCGIAREDLEESFTRGRGNGGQKINKTSSAVRLRHVPTGIEIRCQEERSLAWNRYLARVLLCERLEARAVAERRKRDARVSRERAQRAKRSAAAKRKIVAEKRLRGQVKAGRRKPRLDD